MRNIQEMERYRTKYIELQNEAMLKHMTDKATLDIRPICVACVSKTPITDQIIKDTGFGIVTINEFIKDRPDAFRDATFWEKLNKPN